MKTFFHTDFSEISFYFSTHTYILRSLIFPLLIFKDPPSDLVLTFQFSILSGDGVNVDADGEAGWDRVCRLLWSMDQGLL